MIYKMEPVRFNLDDSNRRKCETLKDVCNALDEKGYNQLIKS